MALLAGSYQPGWFLWVPNWRPPLREGERYGIDVSAHQGTIDWVRAARDGITFAYVKTTEGRDFTDERFDENWREAGLDRGAYHFFTLCFKYPVEKRLHHLVGLNAERPGLMAPEPEKR